VTFKKTIKGATSVLSLDIYKLVPGVEKNTYEKVLSSKEPRLSGFKLDDWLNNALIVLAKDAKGGYYTPVMGFGNPSTTTSTWMGVNLQYPNTNLDNVPPKPSVFFKVEKGDSALTINDLGVFNDAMTYKGSSIGKDEKGSPVVMDSQTNYYSFGTYQHGTAVNLKGVKVTMTGGKADVIINNLPDTCNVPGCISFTLFLADNTVVNWNRDGTIKPNLVMGNGVTGVAGNGAFVEPTFAPVFAPTEQPIGSYEIDPKITWVWGVDGEDCNSACGRFNEYDCEPNAKWPKNEDEFQECCQAPEVVESPLPADGEPLIDPPANNKACTAGLAGNRKRQLAGVQTDDGGGDKQGGENNGFLQRGSVPPADPFKGDNAQQFFPAYSYNLGFTDSCQDGTVFVGTGVGKCAAKAKFFNRYCPCKKPKKFTNKKPKTQKPTAQSTKKHLRKAA